MDKSEGIKVKKIIICVCIIMSLFFVACKGNKDGGGDSGSATPVASVDGRWVCVASTTQSTQISGTAVNLTVNINYVIQFAGTNIAVGQTTQSVGTDPTTSSEVLRTSETLNIAGTCRASGNQLFITPTAASSRDTMSLGGTPVADESHSGNEALPTGYQLNQEGLFGTFVLNGNTMVFTQTGGTALTYTKQ